MSINTSTRLALYGVGLVVVFATALGAGRVAGPSAQAEEPTASHGTAGHDDGGDIAATHFPGGLQVSEAGYRLVPETSALVPGTAADFRFRILGPDGRPVTSYTPTHERDLHLIVVRRDLSGFQHLHPTRASDGLWSVPLPVASAGQYRVFTDFQPAGRDEPLTLGVDLPAAGPYEPNLSRVDSHHTDVDGYRVEVEGHLTPGTASTLTMRISRDGRPVTDLQPYLGAFGHLVVLRDGDLAYLHVHPNEGPDLRFTVEVPSTGTYGLFLDFRHGDVVRTATFTMAGH